jgi:hypothetical protein
LKIIILKKLYKDLSLQKLKLITQKDNEVTQKLTRPASPFMRFYSQVNKNNEEKLDVKVYSVIWKGMPKEQRKKYVNDIKALSDVYKTEKEQYEEKKKIEKK